MSTNPLLTLDESKKYTRAVFEAIREAPVEMIQTGKIANPDNNPYRPSDRLHSENEEKEAIDDLAAQVRELSILHPLIVVDEGHPASPLLIASGLKRYKAAGEIAPVKRLVVNKLFSGDAAKWPQEKRTACLAEALQNVIFTESETNSKLSDESVISLLRLVKENQQVENFEEVMPRLGLKREKSIYRNIKRLWGVVTDDQLYAAYSEGLVPLEIAKVETTQKIFQQSERRGQLLEKFQNYRDSLIAKDTDNATKSRIAEMTGYSRFELDQTIREIELKSSDENEKFVVPVFEVESKNGFVSVPKIDGLMVKDTSRKNVAKVLDVFYNLSMICEQLQGFLDAVKPQSVGGEIKKERALSFSVERPPYGEHYVKFIESRNMHFYANAYSVESYFESTRDVLLPVAERDKAKKSELPGKIIEAFIKRVEAKNNQG